MRFLRLNEPLRAVRLGVLVALFLPGLWIAASYFLGELGGRPLNEAIREFGLWTLRLTFIALTITPLRQQLRWPQLALVRRRIGVAAFCYGAAHLSLFTAQEGFKLPHVAAEIALRIYLTIGFAALLGLAALAATSTDRMVRRMGPRAWQRLHCLVYPIGILAGVHFFMQAKLEVWEPTVMGGILLWLLGYRALARLLGARGRLPLPWVAALGLAATALTGLGEVAWFWWLSGADPLRILAVEFTLDTGLRPAWIVLAWGLALTAAAALRALPARAGARRQRFA